MRLPSKQVFLINFADMNELRTYEEYKPFSNMKYSWTLEIENLQVERARIGTAERYLLERPVPVIVVISAEHLRAGLEPGPE